MSAETPDYKDTGKERALVIRFFPRANDIWLNGQGIRFHNEDLSGGFYGTSAVLSQQPPFAWSLNDASVTKSMLVMDPAYTGDFSKMHEKVVPGIVGRVRDRHPPHQQPAHVLPRASQDLRRGGHFRDGRAAAAKSN